jgi:hypothetical protein
VIGLTGRWAVLGGIKYAVPLFLLWKLADFQSCLVNLGGFPCVLPSGVLTLGLNKGFSQMVSLPTYHGSSRLGSLYKEQTRPHRS